MPPSDAGTQRADRDGVSVAPSFADTEGPRHGPCCWVADEGVSKRSERGRASDERPRIRLAKQKPSRSDLEQGDRSKPAGQRNLHGVEEETDAAHPRGKKNSTEWKQESSY
jgi:hypothetical protein